MNDTFKSSQRYLFSLFTDAVLPVVTYFVLHALGVTSVIAMTLGVLVAVGSTAYHTIRRRKLDGVGLLVILEIAASIGWMYLTQDQRLLMIKPSLYSGIAGVYLLATLFREKPLTYEGVRSMATRGDAVRTVAFERAWERSGAFRAAIRLSTIGWGVASLADAALRVILVYTLPLDRAIWLSNVPHIVAVALLIGFSALMGRRTKPLVEEQLQQLQEEQAATAAAA